MIFKRHSLCFAIDRFVRVSFGSRHASIITAPANNATYTTPASVTITANATDSDGTITKVNFYNGATLVNTDTTAPYSYTLTGLAVGTYSFSAVATDNSGASTTSSPIHISITSASQTPQVYYIHTDQLNTPRLITDSNNAKVWEWRNDDPFGNNVPNDDPNATGNHFVFNQRFAGQYADKETNTNYNYFRDYDAATGRYVESDPIGLAGGVNTYAYVAGNPLKYKDPKGLCLEDACVGESAVAACMANPFCVAAARAAVAATLYACKKTIDLVRDWLKNNPAGPILATPPDNAYDPNGPKSPGKPSPDEGFVGPKGGDDWVRNPNGSGNGWRDKDGNVWVPTDPGGEAHGGPHWDVEKPGGGYDNVYPGGRRR